MSRLVSMKVIPRSSINRIVGELPDGTVKIKLTAAPVENSANEELLRFLSEAWDMPKSKLKIIRGHRQRKKIIAIDE